MNTTPHALVFRLPDGRDKVVPPSGVVVNAVAEETVILDENDICLVRTSFVGTDAEQAKIAALKKKFPGALLVGSLIAAQAFPDDIAGLVPAEGFERVDNAAKRMNPNKFIFYGDAQKMRVRLAGK